MSAEITPFNYTLQVPLKSELRPSYALSFARFFANRASMRASPSFEPS